MSSEFSIEKSTPHFGKDADLNKKIMMPVNIADANDTEVKTLANHRHQFMCDEDNFHSETKDILLHSVRHRDSDKDSKNNEQLNLSSSHDLGYDNVRRDKLSDEFNNAQSGNLNNDQRNLPLCKTEKNYFLENKDAHEVGEENTIEIRTKSLLNSTNNSFINSQDTPIGRRYAEVAHFFNNKRFSDPGHFQNSYYKQCPQTSNFKSRPHIEEEKRIDNFESKVRKNNQLELSRNANTWSKYDGPSSIAKMPSDSNSKDGDSSNKYRDENDCSYLVADIASEEFPLLDATDQNSEGNVDGTSMYDDEMEALLPRSRHLSRNEPSQSRTSLVSSSDGGILAAGETSSEASRSSINCQPYDLGLIERLLLTHNVWFLQGIQRAGAVHFLQGKEDGNFIVRGSSQPNTMAVSVRLPPDAGPYIEHYLIQSEDGILSLESSRFKFDSIPALIAHYAQCCDELPVQLILPQALRDAKNRQQLSSLALLGQEFWRYPMSWPKFAEKPNVQHLDAKSPNSFTDTSGLGATLCSDLTLSNNAPHKHFSPTSFSGNNGVLSLAGTPSDTTSSISSFTTSGVQNMQLMSPESIDSIILTMSPVIEVNTQRCGGAGGVVLGMGMPNDMSAGSNSHSNGLSTFKTNTPPVINTAKPNNRLNTELGPIDQGLKRPQRPKPPNTLNLDLRKPPAPPMRWSKPISPPHGAISPTDHATVNNGSSNFTVTTTVTFSMDPKEISTPGMESALHPVDVKENVANNVCSNATTTLQSFSKRLSPEGECGENVSQGSTSWFLKTDNNCNDSVQSDLRQRNRRSTEYEGGDDSHVLCGSPLEIHIKYRKNKSHKLSKHYQESDILESPQIYCRSALGDKISDYEDLWTQDSSDRASLLSSFKPQDKSKQKRPDILAETPTGAFPNINISVHSDSPTSTVRKSINNLDCGSSVDKPDNQVHENQNVDSLCSPIDLHTPVSVSNSTFGKHSVKDEEQSKANKSGNDNNDNVHTVICNEPRNKQGSPFYAEPIDTLQQQQSRQQLLNSTILRSIQRSSPLLHTNHRHSEPYQSGTLCRQLCQTLIIDDNKEKNAASLDNLQEKEVAQKVDCNADEVLANKRSCVRGDHWHLDKSWLFMNRAYTKGTNHNSSSSHRNSSEPDEEWSGRCMKDETDNMIIDYAQDMCTDDPGKVKSTTVHQIIAKRLPDLNLPELVRSCTPKHSAHSTINTNNSSNRSNNSINTHSTVNKSTLNRNETRNDRSQTPIESTTSTLCRISSYDNVERSSNINCYSSNSANASYFISVDSGQSDDGTVFSEPWDSSQWDSFVPHDDTTLTSESIHFSKCPPLLSEDDTIVDDMSTKDGNFGSKLKKTNNIQKVATILRNRSMRDRPILCHPRNKVNSFGPSVGDDLRVYTLKLAEDPNSTFSRNIENFISCTKESREAAPQVIMRNMRQFMNGMKNYLVKHGEGKFHQEVESARARLKSDEFLNLDAILETVMHQLIILPLRNHLYGIFVDYYTRSDDIQKLAENVKYVCGRDVSEFGIRSSITPPTTSSLQVISNLLLRLQEAELPLDKLDIFLTVIATIFNATGCPRGQQLGADDFLPVLVYVVAKCGFVGAEIEAEFMWGLLQQPLLNGEPGYYLTALSGAVHVLKRFKSSETLNGTNSLDWRASALPSCSSVLRVIIPDECNGSLQTRTLPIRPLTTTREVCRIIAHKARITNPQDYALFKLVNGEETLFNDCECPQDARFSEKGKHCVVAYKRIDAKIAWPTSATD